MNDEANKEATTPTFGIGTIVKHPKYGIGRIGGYDDIFYVVYFKGEMLKVPLTYVDLKAVDKVQDPEISRIQEAIAELLGDHGWADVGLELSSRWIGGTVQLVPGKEGAQAKEIPIETLFKKIIGVREKLRVLEQKINNHPKLDSADKLDLQTYLTRAYGSLTTFNVLFADKTGHFKGAGKGE